MCRLCEIKPVYEFTNKRKLCKTCFIRYVEKKFLYTIRKFKMIEKNDLIAYENKKDIRDVVLKDLLKKFSEKAPVEIVKLPSKKKFNKKTISETLDISSEKMIKDIVKKNVKEFKDLKPVDKKVIKPLYLFLDEEILLYAKLKNLKFKKIKKDKDKLSEFIEELEDKHPEIKRAIVKSYLEVFSS